MCRFSNTGDDWYVLVGVAKDLILNPRSVAGGFVYTYKLVNNGEKLEFLHKVGTRQWPSWTLSPTCLVSKLCPTPATPQTVAHQAPLSMGFSRQVYWSRWSFPFPGDLSDQKIDRVSTLAGRLFTTELHEKPLSPLDLTSFVSVVGTWKMLQ